MKLHPVHLAEQVQELLKAHRKAGPHARADLVFPGERAEHLDGAGRPRKVYRLPPGGQPPTNTDGSFKALATLLAAAGCKPCGPWM